MDPTDRQLADLARLPGVRSAGLGDTRAGAMPACYGADDTGRAPQTAALLRAAAEGTPSTGDTLEEIVVTEADHHLIAALLPASDRFLQVRADRGALAAVLPRVRALAACTAPLPAARRPRGPAPPPATAVSRPVLERVLAALRRPHAPGPHAGGLHP